MEKNRFYFALTILICILVMQISNVANAQSPAISDGLNWLNSTQSADGSWGSDISATDSVQATSAALESLAILNSSNSPNYVNASNWLTAQTFDTTRYLSDRLKILTTSSTDKNLILSGVDEMSLSWGGYDDFTVNALDTALALQALKAANYSDTTVLYQAINYLTTNQNSDGGWAFISGGPSNAYVTAITLRALAAFNSTFNVQVSIDKAKAYLLTKQNSDGGFGSSPSKVYETSLSIISLIESGQGSVLPLQNAINYLASTQLADGSWNDDPYSTALALQALAKVKPNLIVSNISLSKPMPRENEETTITATIKNSGYDTASNITVRFFLGDPSSGGIQIGSDQIIPTLAVNSSTQVSVTASFAGTGGKTIFVVVDPDNLISETSETDNKASARLWVATGPDLAVFSEDLKPSTYVPVSGTAFTLGYTIRNLGESATGAFTVSVYDGDPNAGAPAATPLQTINISGLGGTEVRTGSVGVTLTGDGAHSLYMMADAGYLIQEISETNNTGSVTVQVGGVQQYADITAGGIQLTPSRPHANETVQISASVRNEGLEDASSFTVEIFDGAPESGGTLIHSEVISLASGTTRTITTNWTITAGIHDLYLIVDRTNQIAEVNENKNSARWERT